MRWCSLFEMWCDMVPDVMGEDVCEGNCIDCSEAENILLF